MKRALDIVVAALMLVVLAPALVVIACVVRLSGPGPVVYRGWRVGRGGRPFHILKFRTMAPSADKGSEITVNHDPRVTPMGRLLRATKLDELPQLINVLRGEMSLVGPRPESPHYVARYAPEQRAVLGVRPGITGPSQVLFRHEERLLFGPDPESYYLSAVMPAKLAVDLEYVQHHSLQRDLIILVHTLGALVHSDRGTTLVTAAGPASPKSGQKWHIGERGA
jgi:lipopolysaccharide/colanic/teichoic acid biosynthesis glycosyltransferase